MIATGQRGPYEETFAKTNRHFGDQFDRLFYWLGHSHGRGDRMKGYTDALTNALIILIGTLAGWSVDFFGSVYFLAIIARAAYHARLVVRHERQPIDWWLAFDVPVVFMAVAFGELVTVLLMNLFSLDPQTYERVLRGCVMALAYLGPEGLMGGKRVILALARGGFYEIGRASCRERV